MANPDPPVAYHYRLACYVGPHGNVRESPLEGWATFADIFNRRPDQFRYAIAQGVPLVLTTISCTRDVVTAADEPAGAFICWDLYTDDLARGRGLTRRGFMHTPAPLWTSDSLDGLVMKAIALYDQA